MATRKAKTPSALLAAAGFSTGTLAERITALIEGRGTGTLDLGATCEDLLGKSDKRARLHGYLATPSSTRHIGSWADPDGAASLAMKLRRKLEAEGAGSGAIMVVNLQGRVMKTMAWNPPAPAPKKTKKK
jgi:hypothetical protein